MERRPAPPCGRRRRKATAAGQQEERGDDGRHQSEILRPERRASTRYRAPFVRRTAPERAVKWSARHTARPPATKTATARRRRGAMAAGLVSDWDQTDPGPLSAVGALPTRSPRATAPRIPGTSSRSSDAEAIVSSRCTAHGESLRSLQPPACNDMCNGHRYRDPEDDGDDSPGRQRRADEFGVKD